MMNGAFQSFRLRRQTKLSGPRLRMAPYLKIVDPIFENFGLRLVGLERRINKSKPSRDDSESESRMQEARVYKIEWDYEEGEDDIKYEPGEVPSQSKANADHAYNWTW